jgi:hypothetical protein
MTYVVATKKRPAIILEALNKLWPPSAQTPCPYQVCWTTDYKLPEDWKPLPEYGSLVHNQVGHLRCWRGHQDALKMFLASNHDAALVMEDDAWPNTNLWTTVAATSLKMLGEFEAVSLHGRAFRSIDFDEYPLHPKPVTGRKVLVPKTQGQTWVQGSLAYLMRRDAAERWVNDTYNGYPADLYLCNRYKFALIDPSPFDHNRKHGSLIDCPTPKD